MDPHKDIAVKLALAYQEGWTAAARGVWIAENPYGKWHSLNPDKILSRAWSMGHHGWFVKKKHTA
jgi:hypothetical protein